MKKYSNNYYNKHLHGFANSLRKNFTKSESCLWKYVLRNKQMRGYTFRRQRPVLNYIADFCCLPLRLIIEVDGITHHDEAAQARDELRDRKLVEHGFTVLRFSDAEVLNELEYVKGVIKQWIDECPPPTPASGDVHPLPPPAGDNRSQAPPAEVARSARD